jgi:hypothetical protein
LLASKSMCNRQVFARVNGIGNCCPNGSTGRFHLGKGVRHGVHRPLKRISVLAARFTPTEMLFNQAMIEGIKGAKGEELKVFLGKGTIASTVAKR